MDFLNNMSPTKELYQIQALSLKLGIPICGNSIELSLRNKKKQNKHVGKFAPRKESKLVRLF